jgi:hypothetical protein
MQGRCVFVGLKSGCALNRGSVATRVERRYMTVARIDNLAEESRHAHKRAGGRLNSRVELAVEWEEAGKTLRAKGFTVDISPKGCMAIVEQGLPVGQKLRVVNGMNGKTADATLIWRGHEGRKGWEFGLELEGSGEDFWGVEF